MFNFITIIKQDANGVSCFRDIFNFTSVVLVVGPTSDDAIIDFNKNNQSIRCPLSDPGTTVDWKCFDDCGKVYLNYHSSTVYSYYTMDTNIPDSVFSLSGSTG